MINSFKSFLVEEQKTVYFTFGRMNPPTIGHEKLLSVLAKKAGNNPYRIYLSPSNDKTKNPIPYKEKVKFARKMFPKYARQIIMNNNIRTFLNAASALYDEGFKNVTMVVGSDRVKEFQVLLEKYNGSKGRHGFYNFEKINVISAGDRDPDAEGVTGMSASKMRKAAADGDFTKFSQGVPTTLRNSDTKLLYNAVRKGMGLNEENVFKNHISLEPVSETREQYIRGNLFDVGCDVVIKEDHSIAEVIHLGSNYIIVQQEGIKYRKWLDDVEPISEEERKKESPQDPDIKDRPGTQPKAYHKGLSKSTKAKRDRQFKKQSKMDDDNPAAYKPAPGDKSAKTKPSKHTKRFKQMFGDDVEEQVMDRVKDRIAREKEVERRRDAADDRRHDRMLDRARARKTRRINQRTDQT